MLDRQPALQYQSDRVKFLVDSASVYFVVEFRKTQSDNIGLVQMPLISFVNLFEQILHNCSNRKQQKQHNQNSSRILKALPTLIDISNNNYSYLFCLQAQLSHKNLIKIALSLYQYHMQQFKMIQVFFNMSIIIVIVRFDM